MEIFKRLKTLFLPQNDLGSQTDRLRQRASESLIKRQVAEQRFGELVAFVQNPENRAGVVLNDQEGNPTHIILLFPVMESEEYIQNLTDILNKGVERSLYFRTLIVSATQRYILYEYEDKISKSLIPVHYQIDSAETTFNTLPENIRELLFESNDYRNKTHQITANLDVLMKKGKIKSVNIQIIDQKPFIVFTDAYGNKMKLGLEGITDEKFDEIFTLYLDQKTLVEKTFFEAGDWWNKAHKMILSKKKRS